MLSYRRETALQGALQFSPKVEDWNWETIFYGHYRSLKVIEVGTNRKPICDLLLVINSNLHPISYRFGELSQLIVQILHQPIHFDSKFQVERVVPQQSFLHG